MGRIVVTEFVSLDGVMEDPGGSEHSKHGAWTFKFNRGDEGNKFKVDEVNNAEVQLLGRVTYEGFAAAWPSRSGDPFSDKFNSMPKYLVSSTRESGDWEPTTVIGDDPYGRIRALREEQNLLVWGSPTLVQGLLDEGLVDELVLL